MSSHSSIVSPPQKWLKIVFLIIPLNGNFNFKTKSRKLLPILVSKGKSRTENKKKAHRVAKKLKSGCVYINGNAADPGTPFGGFKQSGNGREGGVWGLEEYLEVKTITGWK